MLFVLTVVLFACKDENYVTQVGVDSSKIHFLNEGGTKTLNVSSNTVWTIESGESWVQLSERQVSGSAPVQITVAPNDGLEVRRAIVIVRSSVDNTEARVVIEQGNSAVDLKQLDFTYQEATRELAINIAGDWTLEKDADWFTLSRTSGEGEAAIDVTVAANSSATPRTGTITFVTEELGKVLIEVQQAKLPDLAGLYILSEGTWNRNQAELAYYDYSTGVITKKYFKAQNEKELGDTGNDLAIYGSKMYCVVSGASVDAGGGHIEIIDPATGISQKRIPLTDMSGNVDMPRRITFYKDKAYVTAYSGMVARLDTASLEIDGRTRLSGTFPEGIAQYGGKLYVCNSGQGTGNTISVVDIASFKESKTISVPLNPVNIRATNTGDIYFSTATLIWSTGAPSNLHLLDAATEKVTKTFDCLTGKLAIANGHVYTADMDYMTYDSFSSKVDLQTKEMSAFTTDFSMYYMAYSTDANPYNGDVYIGGQGQDVTIYGADGTLKTKLKTGTGFTSTVIPVYR